MAAALAAVFGALAQAPSNRDAGVRALPRNETLSYNVEWRFIHAGNARLVWSPSNGMRGGWSTHLHLESAGLVSRLFKVSNDYSSQLNDRLCVVSSLLRANEGTRRRDTIVTFDAARRKANYVERDLVRNTSISQENDVASCEHDVIGALYQLRAMRLEPGRSAELPVSDGKKSVIGRVEAQERETIKTDFGSYRTIRYEAFLFNNVLYRRQGRVFVWLTDDDRRLPVQIRVRLPIYIGTVTLQLEKEGNA
ncbi:MAG TPA: DUF3108 domain-containing protein [Bryobacteraceae bacterium]|nr:DUF3108 domain-containing protein [Bryobacteraceae bacterium]